MDIENNQFEYVYRTKFIYETIKSWWEGHNFPVLPIDFLPEECLMVSNKGRHTHAVFPYTTDSGICWMAFPVSNPNLTKEEKEGGLDRLFDFGNKWAKSKHFKYTFTTTPLESVQKSLLLNGYNLGDENVNHYLKIL